MKKGYIVTALGSRIELVEVAITGTLTNDDLEDEFVINTKKSKSVWASDGILSDPLFLNMGNSGRFYVYTLKVSIRDDVIFDLNDAKEIVKKVLLKKIDEKQEVIDRAQKQLDKLKQPIDWDSFPKDEYISPFTGKKA